MDALFDLRCQSLSYNALVLCIFVSFDCVIWQCLTQESLTCSDLKCSASFMFFIGACEIAFSTESKQINHSWFMFLACEIAFSAKTKQSNDS